MRVRRTAGAKRNGAPWWKGVLLHYLIRETNAFVMETIRTGDSVRVRFGRPAHYNTVQLAERRKP